MAERNTPRRCGSCQAQMPTVAAALAAGWTGGKGWPWVCRDCDDERRRREAASRPRHSARVDLCSPQVGDLDASTAIYLLASLGLMRRRWRS